MVAIPKPAGVRPCLGLALGLCLALASLPATGQTKLSLDQLESRKSPDFTPAYEGRSVSGGRFRPSTAMWVGTTVTAPKRDDTVPSTSSSSPGW